MKDLQAACDKGAFATLRIPKIEELRFEDTILGQGSLFRKVAACTI